MIFNSKHIVIVVALLSAPSTHPMKRTLEGAGSDKDAIRIQAASRNLLQAAKDGDLQRVQALLKDSAEINTHDEYGNTPLHWAVASGHKEVVRNLAACWC